jgi:hypothetical protein
MSLMNPDVIIRDVKNEWGFAIDLIKNLRRVTPSHGGHALRGILFPVPV